MPTGDAFIDQYTSQALISSETKSDNGPTETTSRQPTIRNVASPWCCRSADLRSAGGRWQRRGAREVPVGALP